MKNSISKKVELRYSFCRFQTSTTTTPIHNTSSSTNTKQQLQPMEIESVKCECCGLREDCTQEYISSVEANFHGKWLCGLCAEAVSDEVARGTRNKAWGVEEAVGAHTSFCRKFKSNPAVQVADGMKRMLRRRSSELSSAPPGSVRSSCK